MKKIADYKKLKLKVGLEIHQQIDTKHKLFCNCSTGMNESEVKYEVLRKQHPVASELGDIDIATQHEHMKNRSFTYQTFENETCIVDLDEEPPHNLNMEALETTIQVALLLNCDMPDEIQIMRKMITDGSNTSAFQRTMIIGMNGWLKYGNKKIEIKQICLEEDAASKTEEDAKNVKYKLNRLGIPLMEITTGIIEGYEPEQIQEIAFLIGIICRSTEKVKHGIGSVRQDVNVSIKNGERVEIKGVQELGLLSKVIEKEAERQTGLKKVVKETRSANPDGSTKFNRPLPGAARMYPETDVLPIQMNKQWVNELKENLPEAWTAKLNRFKKKMKLSDDLAIQIIGSDYLKVFEKIIKKQSRINATVVANVFTSTLKDMRRSKLDTAALEERHFISMFEYYSKKKIVKEAFPEILENFIKNSYESISESVKKLNLTMLKKSELNKIISNLVKDSPDTRKEKLYGIAMSRVRGRADPKEVLEIVENETKKR